MAYRTVYIVSKDPAVRDSLAELAGSAGLRTEALPSVDAWLEIAGPESRGCLVLDIYPDDLVDPRRRARFAATCARIPVLVLTDLAPFNYSSEIFPIFPRFPMGTH